MPTLDFGVLRAFRGLFDGKRYRHRDASLGDFVASHLYEDLVTLNKSASLTRRVQAQECVVNLANKTVGKPSRRGDGTFGELVPTVVAVTEAGFKVARGEIANIQIGAEIKILAKAMIKQIDRAISDLVRQTEHFKKTGGNPICVAFVGINSAPNCTSYEGEREWPTDGKNTNIRFRNQPKLSDACANARCLISTNFNSSVFAPPTSRRIRSSGWTTPNLQRNTALS